MKGLRWLVMLCCVRSCFDLLCDGLFLRVLRVASLACVCVCTPILAKIQLKRGHGDPFHVYYGSPWLLRDLSASFREYFRTMRHALEGKSV